MKKNNRFEIPELEIILLTKEDIITSSGGEGEGYGGQPGDEGQGEWGN